MKINIVEFRFFIYYVQIVYVLELIFYCIEYQYYKLILKILFNLFTKILNKIYNNTV